MVYEESDDKRPGPQAIQITALHRRSARTHARIVTHHQVHASSEAENFILSTSACILLRS